MVRPAQVSSSVMLNSNAHRLHYQLPHHPAFAERVFAVGITPQTKSSKNLDYVVTRSKCGMTLYSKSELMVPFVFSFMNNCEPNSAIRVHAEYTEERYANKAVERCPNHQYKDTSADVRQHFVRCEHPRAKYMDNDGSYFVRIPMCDTTGFSFTCFSSCSGGINRRPLQLVFTLESPMGKVQDMCHVALKVCANPLRDSSKEDDKMYSLDSPCDPFAGPVLSMQKTRKFIQP
ncbi:P53 DNA-binding domain protein [Cooperia oncophora]